MKRAKCLFHVTTPENASQILHEGLKRNIKRKTAGIYLSTQPLSWYKDGMRILRVDISGLSHIPANTFLPESDEVIFWGDIPQTKTTKIGEVPRIKDVTDKYVGGK